jgi:hypothetical protein
MPAGAAHAELAEGVLAPAFVTQGARAGKPFTFDLKAALKKGSVVLYFFPRSLPRAARWRPMPLPRPSAITRRRARR